MIKLLLLLAFISSAFPREKDPWGFILETPYPIAELFDPESCDFLLVDKKVKAIIEGPYVQVQSIYTYKNHLDHLVAARFEFPQMENDISQKVEIRHQDNAIIFFDEANSPNEEYTKVNPYTNERFSYKEIQTGRLNPHETVEVIFTVMRPLKINMSQFYELSIRPHHMPRFTTLNSEFVKRNYNIQVELRSERPFDILVNPTHQLQPELSNYTNPLSGIINHKAFYNYTMSCFSLFSGDFKIYFASSYFNAHQIIMATHPSNPHDHAFMFSLIPYMEYLTPWGLKRRLLQNISHPDTFSKLEQVTRQSELRYYSKEYLFVIDRSDSMKGPHLENLKKTLNKIIGALSESLSSYSFLSFGNSSQLHWKQPAESHHEKTSEETREIMKWVETIEADMGDKDLLGALKYAFEEYEWSSLPKNVIILTDGKVTNADEIIQLVQANSHAQKICAIGDGGENGDIFRKIGTAGGCQTEISIPWWSEYFHDRFLEVVDAIFNPPGLNLAYEVTCKNEQNETVYQEEGGIDGIAKNKAFIKWVTLKNVPNLKSCKANIFHFSQHRCYSSSYEGIEIFRSQTAQLTNVWHKVASHAQLHDELQYEESKRKLLINTMQEEDPVVLNECEPQQVRSRYEIYQEKFRNLKCHIPLSLPIFESEQDELEYYGFSSRNEEREEEEKSSSLRDEQREEESFPSWKIISLFQTIFFVSLFPLLFVAAVKIIFK